MALPNKNCNFCVADYYVLHIVLNSGKENKERASKRISETHAYLTLL
jgi:hypothetical protein